jgi:bifunctional DNase/RNase
MVEARIAGVALDSSGQHVILLSPIGADDASRVLPIWIGEQEASSILVAVEGVETPRPLAHDLMKSMLETMDARVQRVDVVRLDGGTFYAEITIQTARGIRTIDARPSDSIALAARTGAPIGVAREVLDEAGVPATAVGLEDDESSVKEFQEFLDTVDPEDFGQ